MPLINDLKVGDTAYVCSFAEEYTDRFPSLITKLSNNHACEVINHDINGIKGHIVVKDENGLIYSASYYGSFHVLYAEQCGRFISATPLVENLIKIKGFQCYQWNYALRKDRQDLRKDTQEL